MKPKFKPNDIVYWGRERTKCKVKEFQPTNGIFGSYWLKFDNDTKNGVAGEDELCYEGGFIRDEIIMLKMLEIMFPESDWNYFKEEFIKNGSENLVWKNKPFFTLEFMSKMFQIMNEKLMMLIYNDYVDKPIASDISDLKFLGIYTHVTFNEWILDGAHLPFPYTIVTDEFSSLNNKHFHIRHYDIYNDDNESDESDESKEANI